jgi:hypothetical protein
MKYLLFTLTLTIILMYGCASPISLMSSISDNVTMGIKTNSTDIISFEFSSKVIDGEIKPWEKDKSKQWASSTYSMAPSATLKRMVTEYISNKFVNVTLDGVTKIKIEFVDFWIEQYTEGDEVMVGLFGGELNYIVVAKTKILLTIIKNGIETTKMFTGSSEDTYVAGVGTHTKTSNVYQGQNSIQNTHSRNINNSYNKVLIMINAYFNELSL